MLVGPLLLPLMSQMITKAWLRPGAPFQPSPASTASGPALLMEAKLQREPLALHRKDQLQSQRISLLKLLLDTGFVLTGWLQMGDDNR